MTEAGRKPSTRLMGFRLRYRDHTQTINGREYTLRAPLCEIERLRLADGIPMMKETRYISLQLFPEIHRKNLNPRSTTSLRRITAFASRRSTRC
jgi:GntR family transcriptional regulator